MTVYRILRKKEIKDHVNAESYLDAQWYTTRKEDDSILNSDKWLSIHNKSKNTIKKNYYPDKQIVKTLQSNDINWW